MSCGIVQTDWSRSRISLWLCGLVVIILLGLVALDLDAYVVYYHWG